MGTPLLGRGVEPDAKTSIVDKILPTIKSIKQDSTLNDNQIDELWDEVEQIYAENSNGTDKGLSQTIDSALAKLQLNKTYKKAPTHGAFFMVDRIL